MVKRIKKLYKSLIFTEIFIIKQKIIIYYIFSERQVNLVFNLLMTFSSTIIHISSTCSCNFEAQSNKKDKVIGIGSVIGYRIGSEIGEPKKFKI